MNKTVIKNYAIWARVQLIESAKQRAFEYEITDGGENQSTVETVGGRLLSKEEKEQRRQLIEQIRQNGYNQVMEEAAYTWFNRFIALRFMEINGYLPSKTRVFTDENGAFKPEILKQAMSIEIDGLDRSKVLELIEKQDNEELYKYLLITQCNALNTGLPYMFEKIANWTELLFPANLLRNDSVIGQMISEIPEEDWTDAVQIIGWMYQYYNSELKDETFALLKKNVKITKERIPAATQLFTPDWIVRYMVENSLGRLWYEGHPDFDKSQWKYYLDEAEQEPEVEQQLKKIRAEYATIRPEKIKVIDPCMGSGHILVYAFDVLMQIYISAGWSERDAAKSILENNLYGLDIDDRAGQLAYFAVMMKARKHSRRILNGEVKPNVLSIQDSNWMTDEFISYVAGKDSNMKADLIMLRKTFIDAKEYGSILDVPAMQYDALYERIDIISRSYAEDLFQAQYRVIATEQLLPLVKQSQIMSQKYDVGITNPPYMGGSGMSAKLSEYIKSNYPDSKADLFAVFIEKCGTMIKMNGFQAMVTMHTWMFITSFEKLRIKLLAGKDICNLAHHGPRAFESDVGTIVQTCSFVFRNTSISNYRGSYEKLTNYYSSDEKDIALLEKTCPVFYQTASAFENVPEHNIAYWLDEHLLNTFSLETIESVSLSDGQTKTGDNDKYLRRLWEVNPSKIGKTKKWSYIAKGGPFRRWYGNIDTIIDWSDTARNHYRKDHVARIAPEYIWFRHGFVFNHIAESEKFAVRELDSDTLFETAAPAIFISDEAKLYYVMAYLNTWIAREIIIAFNPTYNTNVRDITSQPIVWADKERTSYIVNLAKECISISKEDWDSFETSSCFSKHPLMPSKGQTLISACFTQWEEECLSRNENLKLNEININNFFTELYGLTSTTMDNHLAFGKLYVASKNEDVRSFISYAIGCIFGRYSIDVDGICYAGDEWDVSKYQTIIPDTDNIIPICDDDYFDDDIVARFIDFVCRVYGEETLEENLRFISDALGGKGTSREVIRNYFLNGFYDDHLKIYQKRPIYWLFSSGKKNGFKALIYMHRYQPDLLARMRTDYVHEQQERYRTQLQMLEDAAQNAAPSERVKLNKQLTKLKDQALEIQKYEEKIHHLADQMISIDLDDGVKVNYAKFQDVLEKIK